MPLKFAVVREDWELEASLVRHTDARAALVVASGGCTALSLCSEFPALEVVAFDFNPQQLEHLRAKRTAARDGDLAALNIGHDDPGGLNQCGEFERLFRQLRFGLLELASAEAVRSVFDPRTAATERDEVIAGWLRSGRWPHLFAEAFDDRVLLAMFGPEALQHARPGSYAGYFQAVFERGLLRADARSNPFLHHVWLGAYRPDCAPLYATRPGHSTPTLVEGTFLEVEGLDRFDVVSLSNIFDWSDDAVVERWARRLTSHARPGSALLLRQLNNQRPLRHFFEPAFRFDDVLGARLQAQDRSLFYERIHVGFAQVPR